MHNLIPLSEVRAARADIIRAIRNHRYERRPSGIFVPRVGGGMGIHGFFESWKNGLDHDLSPNLVVNTGLNHLLSAALAGGGAISTWYIAPFEGDVTPVAGTTAATFTAVTTECTGTDYDEATRQQWQYDAVANQAITNDTNRATFTIGAGAPTVRGAGILSVSTKGGTTGTLLCYARFAADRTLADGDELTVKYTITGTSS